MSHLRLSLVFAALVALACHQAGFVDRGANRMQVHAHCSRGAGHTRPELPPGDPA